MQPIIRINLEEKIRGAGPVIIELGCGRKERPGRITIDKVDMPHVNIVADIEQGLGFLPDGCVDEIHCRSVLEHIRNFENVIKEIVRVLKKDGRAHIFVPHFSNPHYYSDFTHVRFFGLYTFYYFVDAEYQLYRKVPNFYTDVRIRILSQRLKFRSSFKIINPAKKLLGWFINLHTLLQEYYEENLCYLFPCHGIEIVFSPDS
ncbi:MAG TPA: methyltransferase domain-containing protein [Planctomycetes bacterium]|nr:methyltransferase domain-containing protein [Planctomycetota bacterium]